MRRRRTPDEVSGHEFQQAQMGDLPADIGHERRELPSPLKAGSVARNPRFPPDVAYQDRRAKAAAAGEVGTVSQGASVRSTYDARPINGRDFLHADSFTVPAGA